MKAILLEMVYMKSMGKNGADLKFTKVSQPVISIKYGAQQGKLYKSISGAWVVDLALTKDNIEDILTGEIGSHSHPGGGSSGSGGTVVLDAISSSAPSSGSVGSLYYNTTDLKLYECTGHSGGNVNWATTSQGTYNNAPIKRSVDSGSISTNVSYLKLFILPQTRMWEQPLDVFVITTLMLLIIV